MANTKYIKITEQGAKESRVVLATLKGFFISQGAKIEHPTDEEVYAAFPQERRVNARPQAPASNELKALQTAKASLEKSNDEQRATIKAQAETIADLRNQLAAAETTISESERVIENLRKELAAKPANTKAKAEA